jgi:glycine/D-amino acid oxidase-like deaminating enzyme
VVGAGITGSLIGYYLSKAGLRTVLLDKRDIATGSTCASTGLLQYEVDVHLGELIRRIGEHKAVRSYLLCRAAISKLGQLVKELRSHCEFQRRPSLYLATTAKEVPVLRHEYELRRRYGIDLEFFDSHDVSSLFPFTRPAALYSKEAAEIEAHRLTHALLGAGKASGLEAYSATEVVRFEANRSTTRLVTDRNFVVRARRVVMATGYEPNCYLPRPKGRLKSTYAVISEPLDSFPGWHQRCLIWETARPYLYLRTTRENRAIVGGADENLVNPKQRDALIPRKTSLLVRKFRNLFPDIPFQPAYAWAGTFAESPDGLAYIGQAPHYPRTWIALGYGGNGITYGVIAAELIRDAILGRRNPDRHLFSLDR